MKKIILSAIAVFAFGFANAQQVNYGVKGALNIANQKFEAQGSSVTANSIVGVQLGGFAEVKIAEKFAIQPELLFSTEGSELKADEANVKFNLSYLNIPVMAKFYPTEKFSIQAGPQLGILVSAKGKVDGGSKEDIKDGYKSINFGLNLGAGYELTNNFLVDLRYNFGLSDIAEENEEGLKMTGSVFSIALGYKF